MTTYAVRLTAGEAAVAAGNESGILPHRQLVAIDSNAILRLGRVRAVAVRVVPSPLHSATSHASARLQGQCTSAAKSGAGTGSGHASGGGAQPRGGARTR
eukprot:CAMPEP_0177343670 /NCGR_PEP_ID=MMETSP0368-20130122/27700_1 /TAXON_ID=447022 ORGANISM="Scrippsiella hangoei-like, Strain SHHI-4" /NCGR_SAMPLE_ID=MMETSP0368 /ASSEMBLY_ACC=CAM_ASM_000363 /LENGTH=99 /DNA_ID=CAMNT_0018805119 /DNA_START=13 /DNA_END=310 /DNA_ORIENTATION=+